MKEIDYKYQCCDAKFVSKESTFALRSTTETLDFFVFDRAYFIVVVPSQLLHGFDPSMGGGVLEIVCRGLENEGDVI